MTQTLETHSQSEQAESTVPSPRPARNMISALAVFALGLNAAAAVYTSSPSDFTLPDISRLAELFPLQKASDSAPDPVVTALRDIRSAQQQHVAALQDNRASLQQNTDLLQQDSTTLVSLRQTLTDQHVDVKKISAQITDEHVDVKKISAQISTLIAKVDSLQNAIAPEVTSSIPSSSPKAHARNRLSGMAHERLARQSKPSGPVSIGGAPLLGAPPLGFPAFTPVPQG